MDNGGYDHRHRNLHSRHHHHHNNKSIYLPILCRLSFKDVKLSSDHHHKDRLTSDEPSSPKVSCMGQVKRNNRVIGFPTTTTTNAINATPTNHYNYTKLKRLFSSKTLLPNPTTGAAVVGSRSGSRSCRSGGGGDMVCAVKSSSRKLRMNKDDRCSYNNVSDQECCVSSNIKKVVVNVAEMDPPLPVVKRVAPPRDEVNLWKRRFNGAAGGGLKSLQIDQIQLPNSKVLIQPPPTV